MDAYGLDTTDTDAFLEGLNSDSNDELDDELDEMGEVLSTEIFPEAIPNPTWCAN